MKFSYNEGFGFSIKTSKGVVCCSGNEKCLVATSHDGKEPTNGEFNLGLPCEAEIREILIKGMTSQKGNTVYHFMADGISFAHFGAFEGKVEKSFYDNLGENLDVALIFASEKFNAKAVDQFLDTLSPRVAVVVAPPEMVAAVQTESGAEKAENTIDIKKSDLGPESEKVWVISK
jgi:hypothetical protein